MLIAVKQLAQKDTLLTALKKIKHEKNKQLAQAFSHTYLLAALLVLLFSPIAFFTDYKQIND